MKLFLPFLQELGVKLLLPCRQRLILTSPLASSANLCFHVVVGFVKALPF